MSVEPSKSKLSHLVAALSAAIWALILPLYGYKVYLKQDYTDFEVYYRSAARLRDGLWTEIYSLGDGASPFRYAPLTLPLFRPFALFSYDTAKLIWYFLQYAWFIAGFYLIYRVLKLTRARYPLAVTALSSLFVLRFCLDCFTIGQVSSLLFLAFCASFYAWCLRRPSLGAMALSVPAIFKIGPGILFPLFLRGRPHERLRAVLAPLILLTAWLSGLAAWLTLQSTYAFHVPTLVVWKSLWNSWAIAVAKDSEYFDAAHYGSQSVKSFLLRLVHSGFLSPQACAAIYGTVAVLICSGLLAFWLLRQPRGIEGRAYFFSIGIFPYLWVMPETFKYTLTVLAIPVALLLAEPLQGRFTKFALSFGILTLSLAGKDIVGDTLFFGSQKASIPLLATLFLGFAALQHAHRNSRPSRFYKRAQQLIGNQRPEPFVPFTQTQSLVSCTLIVAIPLAAHRPLDCALIEKVLLEAQALVGPEIKLEPFGDRASQAHPLWIYFEALARNQGWSFADSGPIQPTYSLALRQSFLHSRGKKILILQVDQPCDPKFFAAALKEMEKTGAALVRGNRRQPETRFRIPVRLLRLVYRRHRLGLAFNRLVRWMLPISTTDTHSRMLVMTRELARETFILQGSKDFLFDLELSLVARTHHLREIELPVSLYLATEKTSTQMAWETLSILLGLPVLFWRLSQGFYNPAVESSSQFTADDWGMSPEINQGILELARLGIIRRVSMMAYTRYLSEGLAELMKIPALELGLHFDLTFGKARPRDIFFSHCTWNQKRRRQLEKEIVQELSAQLLILEKIGVGPTYLDGHHHIHLAPGIIDALAQPLQDAGIRIVRLPYDASLWVTRLAVLNILSLLAKSRLKKYRFESLACFYPRAAHFSDLGRFRRDLARNHGAEVIVHPARSTDFLQLGIQDTYTDGRVREYRALLMLQVQPQAQLREELP
jgi:predicted glycoside hydrolase/deacetylase ChbG (UPF0249 family)